MKAFIKNILGKHTYRKIIAFCVDDWGSVHTKDKQSLNFLNRKGVDIQNNRFVRHDTLASTQDFEALFDLLSEIKDNSGNPVCFTAVMNPCNPNFEAIKANGFTSFVSEPFTHTLHKYGTGYGNTFTLWKEGYTRNLFYPVFHGTEHVSRKHLIEALQAKHAPTLWGIECESVGIPKVKGYSDTPYILRPYAIDTPEDNEAHRENIKYGLDQFEELFGFRARQFKAGGDIISPDLYPTLAASGIEYMDEPIYIKRHLGNEKYTTCFNYTGKRNKAGQKVLVRNAMFEPTNNLGFDSVGHCLKLIDAAFTCRKPAIISSHRVNFVGGLDENNRKEGLKRLSILLKEIVKRYPDVEFVNADQAGDIIFEK